MKGTSTVSSSQPVSELIREMAVFLCYSPAAGVWELFSAHNERPDGKCATCWAENVSAGRHANWPCNIREATTLALAALDGQRATHLAKR